MLTMIWLVSQHCSPVIAPPTPPLSLVQARHRSDTAVNNRRTKIFVNEQLVERKWKDIKVGDIIQLFNDEFVTVSSFGLFFT